MEYFLRICFFIKSLIFLELINIKHKNINPSVINGIPMNRKLNCFKINIAPIRPRITFTNKLIILSKKITIVD